MDFYGNVHKRIPRGYQINKMKRREWNDLKSDTSDHIRWIKGNYQS